MNIACSECSALWTTLSMAYASCITRSFRFCAWHRTVNSTKPTYHGVAFASSCALDTAKMFGVQLSGERIPASNTANSAHQSHPDSCLAICKKTTMEPIPCVVKNSLAKGVKPQCIFFQL